MSQNHSKTTITIAHSPDADDFLLFWPLRHGQLSCEDFTFVFRQLDTADLNTSAFNEQFDIVAISAGIYRQLTQSYWVLSSGASVGRGYGPVVIAKSEAPLSSLSGKRVGIPGVTTTAARLFSHLVPDAVCLPIPLTPYQAVFDALDSGQIEAAVVIHEGQLDYSRHGCHLICDLGKWWEETYNLPLPLGLNVIHKRLGIEVARKLGLLLENSAALARANLLAIIPELFQETQRQTKKLQTEAELLEYIERYANADSVKLPEDCRMGLERLLTEETDSVSPFKISIMPTDF